MCEIRLVLLLGSVVFGLQGPEVTLVTKSQDPRLPPGSLDLRGAWTSGSLEPQEDWSPRETGPPRDPGAKGAWIPRETGAKGAWTSRETGDPGSLDFLGDWTPR